MYRQIATLALLAVPALFAPALSAQEVREIDPAWRVVDRDVALARSGPDSVYYTVIELKQGSVVRVDGEAEGFARVRYPAGATVMVPVDEVRVIGQVADGSTRVELVKASGLRAPSELMGMSGSWMAVYEPALAEGTELRVAETLRNDTGDVVGYRVNPVEPPVSDGFARLFVAGEALRDATQMEIDRHLGTVSEDVVSGTDAPVIVEPEENEVVIDEPVDLAVDRQIGTGISEESQDGPEGTEPSDSETVDSEPEPAPVEVSQGARPEATDRQPGQPLLPAGLEELQASFESARKQPAAEVDQALDELLAEFQRTRGETNDDDRLAWQLDQRIEWLQLRIKTRDQRRAIRAALAEADSRAVALEAQVDEWRRGRSYQLVGMLVESSVYNGERLPRMYRVQAVNTIDGSPRTLGYLEPGEGIDSKVGSVVGIIGQARFDPQLRLMVIRADQVDVMPR